MQASIFTEVLLPLALALIMFGMGLSLKTEDFARLWKTPKPIFAGLLGQLILLPMIAFSIAIAFNLSAPLAIGLMILAACPGGTMSNLISQLARANLALSVSLTAIATLVCVITTPLIIKLSVVHFAGDTFKDFSLLSTSLALFFITLVPVAIGMLIRNKFNNWAISAEVVFRKFSLIFMILMIASITYQEWDLLMSSLNDVMIACLALNFVSLSVGIGLAKLFNLDFTDSITLAIEVGIQNATLAILIAITFLNSPEFSVSAGVYGLAMYLGPGLLVVWAKHKRKQTAMSESQPI